MKRTKNLKCIIFLIILALAAFKVVSFPSVANEFYGYATLNWSDAYVGANVTVYDSNFYLCGSFIVANEGFYGILSCNGDDLDTAIDEGGDINESMLFYIDGQRAVTFGNTSWESGTFKEVNITAQNYGPTFDHNLTNQTINETLEFLYDINCSDINYWENLIYYDNTTFFDINPDSGLINWTPVDSEVGNHTINITCSDGKTNASAIFNVSVIDVNNAPVLEAIGNQIAVEDELFTLDIDATDPDNDDLTYSTNATIFNINSTTGLINFTPALSQVDNYSINISVTDGLYTDYEVIFFTIVRGPYCGDGACGSTETCASCRDDCGECPDSGEAEAELVELPGRIVKLAVCYERWECSAWSLCAPESYQTRKCIDVNKCGSKLRKPTGIRECVYEGDCNDGTQNCHDGACEAGIDCGGPCNPCPVEINCFDGIKNCHDGSCEEKIDCGGPCEPCEVQKFAEIPIELEKLAPIAKKYPWLFLILIGILISSAITGDRLYIRKITKKELEYYRKKMQKYKKVRSKIYLIAAIASIILLIASLYMYQIGGKKDILFTYSLIALIVGIIVTILIPYIITTLKYYDYKTRKKDERFFNLDKRKKESIAKIEDYTLTKLEIKIGTRIYESISSLELEEDVDSEFKEIYRILVSLTKKRRQKLKSLETSRKIKHSLKELRTDIILAGLSKEYPEFNDVLKNIKKLGKNFSMKKISEEKTQNLIQEFITNTHIVTVDKHLMTVIKSNDKTVALYNDIVDIYSHYQDQINLKYSIQNDLMESEKVYKKKIENITDQSAILTKIKENPKLTSIYNSLVDIYNHYKKKEDIYNEISQLPRSS